MAPWRYHHVGTFSWVSVVTFLGDNCIQNFHLGGISSDINLVLRRRVSGAVKHDFRTYIRRYTSPNENFEYRYPHSNAQLAFPFKMTVKMYSSSGCQLHKTACLLHIFTCQPMKSDVTHWRRICDSISQVILLQIYDAIQSDVSLLLQVH